MRGPRNETRYFPGANTNNIGVLPTNLSSIQTCDDGGVERISSLLASWPACSSSARRFKTWGGGPAEACKCGEAGGAASFFDPAKLSVLATAVVVPAETEVAPAVSARVCVLAGREQNRAVIEKRVTKTKTLFWRLVVPIGSCESLENNSA